MKLVWKKNKHFTKWFHSSIYICVFVILDCYCYPFFLGFFSYKTGIFMRAYQLSILILTIFSFRCLLPFSWIYCTCHWFLLQRKTKEMFYNLSYMCGLKDVGPDFRGLTYSNNCYQLRVLNFSISTSVIRRIASVVFFLKDESFLFCAIWHVFLPSPFMNVPTLKLASLSQYVVCYS